MNDRQELFISAQDAEALAAMLGTHRRSSPFEADASDELADLLMEARMVAPEHVRLAPRQHRTVRGAARITASA